MNSATEIVVRWHLDQQGTPEDFTEELVHALYVDCAAGLAEAIELRDRFVLTVTETERDAPWDSVIDMAIALHHELEGVDKAIHNLEQIAAISKAVENVPDNGMARKITALKIKECISRIKR